MVHSHYIKIPYRKRSINLGGKFVIAIAIAISIAECSFQASLGIIPDPVRDGGRLCKTWFSGNFHFSIRRSCGIGL